MCFDSNDDKNTCVPNTPFISISYLQCPNPLLQRFHPSLIPVFSKSSVFYFFVPTMSLYFLFLHSKHAKDLHPFISISYFQCSQSSTATFSSISFLCDFIHSSFSISLFQQCPSIFIPSFQTCQGFYTSTQKTVSLPRGKEPQINILS